MTDELKETENVKRQNVPLTAMLGEIKCKTAPEAISVLDLIIDKIEGNLTPHAFDCVLAYVKAKYMGD